MRDSLNAGSGGRFGVREAIISGVSRRIRGLVRRDRHPVHVPPLPALPDDFIAATSLDTAHGRYEERRLRASSLLVGYTTWPAAKHVFPLERRTLSADRSQRMGVAYGITSLPRRVADADRLLALARGHRGIENGLFYRRDVAPDEDRRSLRRENGPHVLATFNDLTAGLLRRDGHTNAAAGR
jgi:hypothetical protein